MVLSGPKRLYLEVPCKASNCISGLGFRMSVVLSGEAGET